jgi:hypothetical protein
MSKSSNNILYLAFLNKYIDIRALPQQLFIVKPIATNLSRTGYRNDKKASGIQSHHNSFTNTILEF